MGTGVAGGLRVVRSGFRLEDIPIANHWSIPLLAAALHTNIWLDRSDKFGFLGETGLSWHLPLGLGIKTLFQFARNDLLATDIKGIDGTHVGIPLTHDSENNAPTTTVFNFTLLASYAF